MQNKTEVLLWENHMTIERYPEHAEAILSLGEDFYYLQQLLFTWLWLEDLLKENQHVDKN